MSRKVSQNSLDNLKLGQCQPLGEKALSRKVVAVKLPIDLFEYVKQQPNINQWLIAAVADRVKKEIDMGPLYAEEK